MKHPVWRVTDAILVLQTEFKMRYEARIFKVKAKTVTEKVTSFGKVYLLHIERNWSLNNYSIGQEKVEEVPLIFSHVTT